MWHYLPSNITFFEPEPKTMQCTNTNSFFCPNLLFYFLQASMGHKLIVCHSFLSLLASFLPLLAFFLFLSLLSFLHFDPSLLRPMLISFLPLFPYIFFCLILSFACFSFALLSFPLIFHYLT